MKFELARWRQLPRVVLALLRWGVAAVAVWLSMEFTDDVLCGVMNAGLFLIPFALLLALTGRWIASLSGASAFVILLYVTGELKFKYFGNRLAVSDYAFLIEPANWSIVKQYPLLQMALGGFLLLLSLLIGEAMMAQRGRPVLGRTPRLAALLLVFALLAICWAGRRHHNWDVFQDEADCGDAHRCGLMARLVFSTSVFEFDPPAHEGDPSVFLQRQAELPPEPAPAHEGPLPDIVLWLNESTFNPRNFVLPNAHLPRFRMFERTENTRAGSLMRTHTFGGKTWLSEFSSLTGLVPDDFGGRRNLVFNAVSPKLNYTLVRLLKDNGYKIIVLMPTFKRFYGAGRTYEAMGFDEVLTLRDFHEYDKIPGDEWDIAESPRLSEAAQTLIRRHREGPDGARPLFLYMLSIHEHAPYSKSMAPDYNLDHAGLTPGLASSVTDYIGRLRELEKGVTGLDGFLERGRPMLFAWFGDHQAYYETGEPPYRFELPEPRNVTQFQIRANYETPPAPITPLMDIAYLPSLIADFTGVKKDAYFNSLSAMRRLCAGMMDECGDAPLVLSYKAYLFSPDFKLFRE